MNRYFPSSKKIYDKILKKQLKNTNAADKANMDNLSRCKIKNRLTQGRCNSDSCHSALNSVSKIMD